MADENTVGTATTKTFTQEEVNAIIQQRVSKYADYNDLKAKAERASTLEKELATTTVAVDEATGTLTAVLQDLETGIPEDKKSLIPEGFSIEQKIKYIQKNKNILLAKNTTEPTVPDTGKVEEPVVQAPVSTPPDKTKTQTVPPLYGGFATQAEWAKNKPAEFLKWRKTQSK